MKRIALALVAGAVAGLALVATQNSWEPARQSAPVVVADGDTPQDTSWGWRWNPRIVS
ncbi:hypothetical protein [Kitasatospora sp. NPDC088346]|uniref:hypothetical protein n=1 Tax=Kitasatospora sp. NPDC088346 TaxID=3364073 RepID=UPI00380348B5